MIKTKPKQETKIMRQQTGSRNRGWLSAIRRRLESYGGHVGNRLSVAAGVALVAGMMAGTAWGSPVATGGTETNYQEGGTNWTAHIFTTTGITNIVFSKAVSVEYLVVGGGGAGGGSGAGDCYGSGGGGAGGYRVGTYTASAQSYTVIVGTGGVGRSTSASGGDGGSSVVFSVVSAGGGGGALSTGAAAEPGRNGGSGGGGSGSGTATYAGGLGNTPATTPMQGTNGGAYSGTKGTGGSSIGGNGGDNVPTAPQAGQPNTGSGGGGCAGHNRSQTSGAGGSGIVIVRYAIIAPKGTVIMMR
jgi:hypothetical protein